MAYGTSKENPVCFCDLLSTISHMLLASCEIRTTNTEHGGRLAGLSVQVP